MTWRGAAWSLCAGVAAVVVAWGAWQAGRILLDALGLDALRPLVPVIAVFLALTALQATWVRAEAAFRSTSRRGHS